MAGPVVLIIRDGWGINPRGRETAEQDGNATLLARTPFHDELYTKYPWGTLSASGMDVGLPDGQMGNSEVGHLNLGAGRIVYQDLTRIHKAIADGDLARNGELSKVFAKAAPSRLHLIGLVSDGGVHSHQDHIVALANAAKNAGVKDICVHAITDGRDTSPTDGSAYLARLEEGLRKSGARIITVVGRYYAMDRDERWERTKLGWDAIVHGIGEAREDSPSQAVAANYPLGKTDEFMPAMVFGEANVQRIRDGDVILWFNFRADRARQLSRAFLYPDFAGFERGPVPRVYYATLTEYDATYPCAVIFPPQSMNDTLGEVVAGAGLRQLRAAETEKYPHVTYFFNGGVEKSNPGEDRYLAISPKEVATYDIKPQMSGPDLAFEVVRKMENYDLIILNFANPDMVGHTGVVKAGIHAVETIDLAVRLIVEKALALGGQLLITADHGNCELMRNEDGSPNTAHTTFLVHAIYVAADAGSYKVQNGILADVAPTLLAMLRVAQPAAMTGKVLLIPSSI